jgi:hypothetical protein
MNPGPSGLRGINLPVIGYCEVEQTHPFAGFSLFQYLFLVG